MKFSSRVLVPAILMLAFTANIARAQVIDTSFGNQAMTTFALSNSNEYSHRSAVDSLNRVVLVGSHYGSGGDFGIVRLLSDGSPDTNFGYGGQQYVTFNVGGNNIDTAIDVSIVQGDIYVAGNIGSGSYQYALGLTKLDSTGTQDISWGGNGTVVFSLPGRSLDVKRLIYDGSGFIAVGTAYSTTTDGPRIFSVRFDMQGNIDTQYGNGGVVITSFRSSASIRDGSTVFDAELSAGKLSIAGSFTSVDELMENPQLPRGPGALLRLDSSGQPDTTLAGTGRMELWFGDTDIIVDLLIRYEALEGQDTECQVDPLRTEICEYDAYYVLAVWERMQGAPKGDHFLLALKYDGSPLQPQAGTLLYAIGQPTQYPGVVLTESPPPARRILTTSTSVSANGYDVIEIFRFDFGWQSTMAGASHPGLQPDQTFGAGGSFQTPFVQHTPTHSFISNSVEVEAVSYQPGWNRLLLTGHATTVQGQQQYAVTAIHAN